MARQKPCIVIDDPMEHDSKGNMTFTDKTREEVYKSLLKDCENENTARIMSNNDHVCRLWFRLRGTKKLVWDTYDVCPWCKKTIRVDGRCSTCRH